MEQQKTYYEVLDLPEDASKEDIKQAYRDHVKEWHPDLHPEKANAAEKTQEINEAYSVLSDPDKRHKYDEYLSYTRIEPEPVRAEETGTQTYSSMSFRDYVENVANESYAAYQDSFDGEIHKFDEEGYKEYVKNKGTVFDKKVDNHVGIIIGFAALMTGFIIISNSKVSSPLLFIIPTAAAGIGIVFEISKRNKAAKEAQDRKLGGNDSIAEADNWFEVWLYPEMPLSECRKVFFSFSVRVDKHILSRFNNMSTEDKEQYAGIIELLEECIIYRERK